MDLAVYFNNITGTGILATSDAEGNVNAALYMKPYIIDEKTVAFSMMQRLTYANIQSNPRACFVFIEKGEGYKGKRLYLTKIREETDIEKIKEVKKRHTLVNLNPEEERHLVYFEVNSVQPLIGEPVRK